MGTWVLAETSTGSREEKNGRSMILVTKYAIANDVCDPFFLLSKRKEERRKKKQGESNFVGMNIRDVCGGSRRTIVLDQRRVHGESCEGR